jgi:hypothetical protein
VPAAKFSARESIRQEFVTLQWDGRGIPPNGPREPPECSNLQLLAHCWALLARLSLQVKSEAPCWARTELCADKYCPISPFPAEDAAGGGLGVWGVSAGAGLDVVGGGLGVEVVPGGGGGVGDSVGLELLDDLTRAVTVGAVDELDELDELDDVVEEVVMTDDVLDVDVVI